MQNWVLSNLYYCSRDCDGIWFHVIALKEFVFPCLLKDTEKGQDVFLGKLWKACMNMFLSLSSLLGGLAPAFG
ncbi:hypothetical protein DUNSADRAFT_18791 [Dunaliella salina]|uniref:Uncharacterized protein n=1 Tax=Dunaliella salina TaxID=3046 RepID=A0ABQ7FZH9_DUNSA|nr:hypothetical protein DUNSADRAFT_18791 [Dunaliella salina]|eukprot:KAF5827757.1 hypothetical protein DUNSADRAFT_18791 [Dunaliella salina]